MTGKLQDVTDDTFEAKVLDADGPVLVDCGLPGAVRAASYTVLEEIDGEREDLKSSASTSTRTSRRPLSTKSSIPTMLLFKDGAWRRSHRGDAEAAPRGRARAALA